MSMETQTDSHNQIQVLKAFSRALRCEALVKTQNPDLLWQQLYNCLQCQGRT